MSELRQSFLSLPVDDWKSSGALARVSRFAPPIAREGLVWPAFPWFHLPVVTTPIESCNLGKLVCQSQTGHCITLAQNVWTPFCCDAQSFNAPPGAKVIEFFKPFFLFYGASICRARPSESTGIISGLLGSHWLTEQLLLF